MRSFKDKNGTSWDIEVTTHTRALVSARTGIDLLLIGQGDQHTFDLLLSPEKSLGVLLALTEQQRTERTKTDADFGNALNDAEISDAALDAIVNATFDFFPKAQAEILRKTMLTLLEIRREEVAEMIQSAQARINAPDFKEKLREKLRPKSKAKSSASPESSESTPADSVGGNST